jgi:predicted transcriptional regulator of viral defense system
MQKRIAEFIKQNGVMRPCDLKSMGISDNYLLRLAQKGTLEKIGRGVYSFPNAMQNESRQLVEISARVPHSVICLISALQFHQLTTQAPSETWIALKSQSWKPKIEYPPIHVVWFSNSAFQFGIEEHYIENALVRVYSCAKTIADCFKYRNKIGLDVAIEALRDALRNRKATIDQIWQAAKICRVAKIMRPFLEATA